MARPKLGDSDTERLHIKITRDEIEDIETWRFANRVQSKSEAVRRLCQMGLQADANLNQIRAQTDGTYEFIARRFEQALRDLKKVRAAGEWTKAIQVLLTMNVDTMQMVGSLGSTVRQATAQANTMKGNADVSDLITMTKDVAREYDVTRKRMQEIMRKLETDE